MPTIFWFAQLKPGVDRDAYEQWVKEVDYPAARVIPSIISYRVYRIQSPCIGNSKGPFQADYVELVVIKSLEDYAADLKSHPAVKRIIDEIGDYIQPAGNVWGVPIDEA